MYISKILAVRNDRLGEFLLTLPAIRALKQYYSNAKLSLVVGPSVEDLAKAIGFVDEVIPWENKKHSFFEMLAFSKKLKANNFDLCVIFNPTKEFNIISLLADIPERLGYDRKWGFLLTQKIEDKKDLALKHEVEYNLDLVGAMGITTQDKALALKIDETKADSILERAGIKRGEDLVALHPWTSDITKQWPKNYFVELSKRLVAKWGIKTVIAGGIENLDESKALFSNLSGKIINLTGKTTLLELAALLKKCRFLISADSGPVHLAQCVNTPVIVIFRNDIVGKNAKRWGPWGTGNIVIERDNLVDISVEEVLSKASAFLDLNNQE